LVALQQEDGQPPDLDPTQLHRVRPGNLAFGNGCLVIADQEYLWAYVPEARLLEQRGREHTARPRSAEATYRLALAEADAGLFTKAVEHFAQTERLADRPLRELAGSRRHDALLDQAQHALSERKWDQADVALKQAMAAEFPVADRLRALVKQAEVWVAADQPGRVADILLPLIESDSLRWGQIVDGDGHPQIAAVFAASRVRDLLGAQGETVRAKVAEHFRLQLDAARGEQRTEVLERLAQHYLPDAGAGPALLELAELHEKAGRPSAVVYVCRRWFRRYSKSAGDEARVYAKMARALEQLRLWGAARDQWQQLAASHGDRTLPELDPKYTVVEFVKQQLQKAEYRAATTERSPLVRQWTVSLEPEEQLVVPAAVSYPSAVPEVLFSLRGPRLCCRDAASGKASWVHSLPFTPSWLACHADSAVAAGADGVCSLRLADGRLLWQYAAPAVGERRPPFSEFELAGLHLICLQDDRRLLALDLDTGKVLWSRWAPGARLGQPYPHGRFQACHTSERTVLVQVGGGRAWVLDAPTGWLRGDLKTTPEPWSRPPLTLDGQRIGVVRDAQHITLFDAAAGQELWTHLINGTTTLSGEPPIVSGEGRSFILVIARNYGYALQRLDAETGKACWPEERLLGPEPIAAESIACDPSTVYVSSRNVLSAYALADGKRLWELPLIGPAGRWRTRVVGEQVLVHPLEAWATDFSFRWLSFSAKLERNLPWEDPAGRWRGLPVLLCDARTGRLTQRLNFSVPAPQARRQLEASPGTAGLPGITAWLHLKEGQPPAVQVVPRGVVVAVDGIAWRLSTP
jgi:outer membrane protein assembly factor BamB